MTEQRSDTGGPQRLDKRVAALLGCSRGEARQYIEGGWVRVDGRVVELPQHRVAGEAVSVDADAQRMPFVPATILLHKPAGLSLAQALAGLGPDTRWAEDESGIRGVQRHFKHLEAVFALEDEAAGLVVVSQDARVLRWAQDMAAGVEQEYVVELDGEIPDAALARLGQGAPVGGRTLPPAKASRQSECRLRLALKGARPGDVRALAEAAGLGVTRMRRLRLGRVGLARMPAGQWRYLAPGQKF
jgi:23S rRNA pseudouridine2604 synthase